MIYRRIVLTTLLIIIGACVLIADNNNEKPITGANRYYLSPEKVQIYAEQANKGDGDAAYKLGRHYSWGEGNMVKAYYWLEKGIQVDNMSCLFEFGTMFMNSSMEDRRIIALQCFNPILQEAENGNEEAIKYISKLPKDIREAAKVVDNIPDEEKEAAAKYLEELLDKVKKEVEEEKNE